MATEREVAIERVGKRAACFIPARQICCCLHGFELHAAAPTRRPFLDVARCFDSRLRIARARKLPITQKSGQCQPSRLPTFRIRRRGWVLPYNIVRRTQIQQRLHVLSSDTCSVPIGPLPAQGTSSPHTFRAGSANSQPASMNHQPRQSRGGRSESASRPRSGGARRGMRVFAALGLERVIGCRILYPTVGAPREVATVP